MVSRHGVVNSVFVDGELWKGNPEASKAVGLQLIVCIYKVHVASVFVTAEISGFNDEYCIAKFVCGSDHHLSIKVLLIEWFS